MLVVDKHALQTVDFLDLIDEIGSQSFHALDCQDVVRCRVTVEDVITLFDVVAVLKVEGLALRDQVLDRFHTVLCRLDGDATLVLVVAAQADRTIDLGDDGMILRTASFEQFGHTRQTTGDVLGLRAFERDTCKHVALGDLGTGLDRQDGIHGQLEAGFGATRSLGDLTLVILDDDGGLQIGATRRRTPVDDLTLGDAGRFVGGFRDGHATDDVLEFHRTCDVRHHRAGIRVPLGQTLAALDRIAVVDKQLGAVSDALRRPLVALLVHDLDRHVAAHGDQMAVRVAQQIAVTDLDRTLVGGFQERLVDHGGGTAKVEGTHGELCTRLPDRLCRDDTDGFALVDGGTACQVATVAGCADAGLDFAGQRRADAHRLNAGFLDQHHLCLINHRARLDDVLAGGRVVDVVESRTAQDTLADGGHDLTGIDDGRHGEAFFGTAIDRVDDAILRHVNETAGQVTRVRSLQRGIGQTLTGTVGRVEVLVHGQAFLEVRDDRRFDDLARRLGHQAAHPAKLTHLAGRTTGTGVAHHVDRVHLLLTAGLGVELDRLDSSHHLVGNLLGRLAPGVDDLVVLLALSDQAVVVLLLVFLHHCIGVGDDLRLGRRDDHVVLAEGNTGAAGMAEAELHDPVTEDDRILLTAVTIDGVDHPGDVLLGHLLVAGVERNHDVLRQKFADQHAARGRFVDLADLVAVGIDGLEAALHLRVQGNDLVLERMVEFAEIGEHHPLARFLLGHDREIVETKHHVLRRHDDRCAVRRVQNVVGRHHEHAGFKLGFKRERHVNGHLVAIEVGVERGADERVQLDGLAFDQGRFEGLDTQTVKRRRTVQENRVLADDLVEDIPDFRLFLLDQLLGLLDGRGVTLGVETGVDERLEELERHLFRQAALVQLEFRTGHDDRTARIVDALAEQVLTEAALLALEHVGQRLQRTLVGTRDDATATAVVEERIDSFLQHPLFVADDDAGRAQFDQALQTVVTIDHATVEVVEVGRRETAAIERNQRTQVRRDHRDHFHDHPFWAVAGIEEILDDLQALHQLLLLQVRSGRSQFGAQFAGDLLEFHACEKFEDGFGADHCGEGILAELVDGDHVFLFRQKLVFLQRRQARLGDDIVLEIEHALDILERHVEKRTDAGRQRLEEPDVGDGSGELDVAHALTANARQRDFHAALFADDALVLHALVLAAQALIVLHRTEDARAEQAVAFRLERTVVDGLGLLDLAVRPGKDLLRAGNRNPDGIEGLCRLLIVEKVHDLMVHACLL